jgi:hypothetical protein
MPAMQKLGRALALLGVGSLAKAFGAKHLLAGNSADLKRLQMRCRSAHRKRPLNGELAAAISGINREQASAAFRNAFV